LSLHAVQVWLKADLRVDDHEGLLQAAAAHSAVLPVYCLDVRRLHHLAFLPAGPESECVPTAPPAVQQLPACVGINSAPNSIIPSIFFWCSVVHAALAGVLRELRDALRARGSDLLVVRGRWEEVVPRLAAAAGVSQVYAQQEVEHM
jgi:deoxyribodipyrimidine photolyase